MSKKKYTWLILIPLLLGAGIGTYFVLNKNEEIKVSASVTSALSDTQGTENFSKADKPKTFIFPKDSGSHPDFQTEWWYYTGNLEDKNKNNYGYQLTFFRRALNSEDIKRDSKWKTNQIYFAHFTVSDIKNNKFYYAEKYSREGNGLSGVNADPFNVWLEDWQAKEDKNGFVNIKADNSPVAIDLKVKSLKPVVLQGNQGLSNKSAGNASYYYSLTRLDTQGSFYINNEKFDVKGLSWLDREWSTSALSKDQSGWDWFSIQLDDQRELMLYQLRLKNGGIDSYSSGCIIDKNGKLTNLKKDDFKIEVLDYWKSPTTN
ncbi:carotenoid 1,2-hydratase, partial [bacterium]